MPQRPKGDGKRRLYGDPEAGARLRNYRRSRGLTQDDLAQRLGTERKIVAAWERGRRAIPAAKALILVQEFPSLSLDWLLRGKGAAPVESAAERLDAVERQLAEMRVNVEEIRADLRLLKGATVPETELGKVVGKPERRRPRLAENHKEVSAARS